MMTPEERIEELEECITANDAHMQKIEEQNCILRDALKQAYELLRDIVAMTNNPTLVDLINKQVSLIDANHLSRF